MKKLTALLLALVLSISLIPLSASAQGGFPPCIVYGEKGTRISYPYAEDPICPWREPDLTYGTGVGEYTVIYLTTPGGIAKDVQKGGVKLSILETADGPCDNSLPGSWASWVASREDSKRYELKLTLPDPASYGGFYVLRYELPDWVSPKNGFGSALKVYASNQEKIITDVPAGPAPAATPVPTAGPTASATPSSAATTPSPPASI